ncbi:MAG: glycosyltransferase family 39 protein [Candidatus Nealsonbacteria bacterium]
MPKNNYLVILIILACLNALGILYFFSESIERSDTLRYVQTIEYFWGGAEAPSLSNLVKPLSMVTAAFLSPLAGPRGALFLQNLLFYFISIVLVFKIIKLLYFNERQAFFGAILFMTSFPMLENSLSFLTDMTGWFFLILVTYLALNFYRKPSLKLILISGLLSGIGFLFKESGVGGAVFFAFLLLFSGKFRWPEKIKYGLIFSLCVILPILLSIILISSIFNYSYFDWYGSNLQSPSKDYNWQNIIQQTLVMFLLGWVFVAKGAWQEWKKRRENEERKPVLLAMIPLFFTGFLWPMPVARVLFMGFPLLLCLGSRGLLFYKKPWLEFFLLSLFVVINYSLPNIFSIEDLSGLLGLIF